MTPSSRGLPVGPRRWRTPSHATARPRLAKLADRWRCRWPSTLTTNAPWLRTARRVALLRSKQTSSSGGSSDSDVTALAVVPTGSPSSPIEVTTVTPVAKCPMASRNSTAETPGAPATPASLDSSIVVIGSQLPMVRREHVVQHEVPYMVVFPGHGDRQQPAG